MAGLDFRRATDLFLGREEELALALDLSTADVRRFRQSSAVGQVPDEVMRRLAKVLLERGRGMVRVAELLQAGHD